MERLDKSKIEYTIHEKRKKIRISSEDTTMKIFTVGIRKRQARHRQTESSKTVYSADISRRKT